MGPRREKNLMDNYFAHQELIKKTKLLLTKRMFASVRLFDRTIGLFYRKRANGGVIDYSPIKIGKNGQCDMYGVVKCFFWVNENQKSPFIPVHIEFEYKTGKSVLSEDQVTWKEFCDSMGWVHIIVRENTDVIKEIYGRINALGLWVWEPV